MLLWRTYESSNLKMFQTKSLLKNSNISTGKITMLNLNLLVILHFFYYY